MKSAMEREKAKGQIDPEQTVVGVIQRYPKTLEVFARHGLDTCCGGIHPIAMAARAHGVDVDVLIAELERVVAAAA